jgi:hypothetical protein
MRRGVGQNVSVGGRAQTERAVRGRDEFSNQIDTSQDRELIARFFRDLRRALRLTLPQAAQYLRVHPEIIEVLETGQVEYLPSWPQTAQIILGYTAMAGVDGRPALNAVGALMASIQEPQPPVWQPPVWQPPVSQAPVSPAPVLYAQVSQAPVSQAPVSQGWNDEEAPEKEPSGRQFMRARSAIANGARRLPKDAIHQIRERPQRALYALSLPLFAVLFFHASIFGLIARPFSAAVNHASAYFQEHFAPVRDGFRWIEVSDPRSRRGDKLQIAGGSY